MKRNKQILYINAPAGSGKSEILIRESLRLAREGENILILFPTKLLIKEMIKRFQEAGSNSIFITIIVDEERPTQKLKECLDEPMNEGQIVLATHAAFIELPHLNHPGEWRILIDETLDVCRPTEMNVAETHDIITNHLTPTISCGGDYSIIKIKDGAENELRDKLRNPKNDEILAHFRPIAALMLNSKWMNYVSYDLYNRLINNHDDVEKLTIYSILSPSFLIPFKSVTVSSALFTDSLMYLIWSSLGVDFVPETNLMEKLRYQHHENGSLVTFAWMTQQPWTKNLRSKRGVTDEVVAATQHAMNGKAFVWAKNLTDNGTAPVEGCQMSVKSHGCNDYMNVNQVAVLFSCNPKPDFGKFLKEFNLTSDQITIALHRSAIYQSIMRISIRDPENHEPKMVVVPSLRDAEWLSELFPNSKLSQIPNSIDQISPNQKAGRHKIHASDAARVAHHRMTKRTNIFISSIKTSNPTNKDDWRITACNEKAIEHYRNNVTLSVFINKFELTPYMQFNNWVDFNINDVFERLHSNRYKKKDANLLGTTAVFDESLSQNTSRGLDNVVSITGIWLDYDDGELTPQAFSSLFDDVEMLIYNTWSSTPSNNKWRAFIPTSSSMDVDEYEAVVRGIVAMTDAQTGDGNGFDKSKFHAASLFYLPCQANDPEGSFFHDLRDGRGILDPQAFLRTISWDQEPETPLVQTTRPENVNEEAVEEAIRFWSSVCGTKGVGNYEFFMLGLRLATAGMDEAKMRQTLFAQAAFARSPEKRRKGIDGVIDRIRKYGHL